MQTNWVQSTAIKSCFKKKMEKATHYFRRKPHRNYNDCDDSDGTMCQMSYTDQHVLTVVCKLWSCVSWKFSLKGGGKEKKWKKTQCFSDFVTKNVSSFTHNMLQTLASLQVTPLHPPATPIPPHPLTTTLTTPIWNQWLPWENPSQPACSAWEKTGKWVVLAVINGKVKSNQIKNHVPQQRLQTCDCHFTSL